MRSAGVESIDALKAFRAALWKFAETVNSALSDTDGEMERTMVWLECEQSGYWAGQIRKRTELVSRAKDALRAKKLFRSDITKPSTIEEEKALAIAERRLEEANQKAVSVKKSAQKLRKEILLYRGQVQRLANMMQVEVPAAAQDLDQMVATLETYVGMAPTAGTEASSEQAASAVGERPSTSMRRSEPGASEQEETPEAAPEEKDLNQPNQ